MRKISKDLHRVILTELFIKSHKKRVSIKTKNHDPFLGIVKNVEDLEVEIEENGFSNTVNILEIEELYLLDE